MTAWTSAELDQVGRAEELEVVSRRRDGTMTSSSPAVGVELRPQ
jgi:hypothetical protein